MSLATRLMEATRTVALPRLYSSAVLKQCGSTRQLLTSPVTLRLWQFTPAQQQHWTCAAWKLGLLHGKLQLKVASTAAQAS